MLANARAAPSRVRVSHAPRSFIKRPQTYYCYIHTCGKLAPELRTIEAADVDAMRHNILGSLQGGAALDDIDLIDVYLEDEGPVCRIGTPRETAFN